MLGKRLLRRALRGAAAASAAVAESTVDAVAAAGATAASAAATGGAEAVDAVVAAAGATAASAAATGGAEAVDAAAVAVRGCARTRRLAAAAASIRAPMLRGLLAAALLLPAIAYAESAGSAAQAASREEPRIGAAAPAFSLEGLDGGSHSLAEFRGKPVVLNFWASWCGPCRDEAPLFARLYKDYGSKLQIVAINLTDVDSEKSAREFASAYGFEFPVLFDEKGHAADSYRIRPIPTTFFIDAKGIIQDGVLGAMTWEELDKRAERLLQ